MNLSGNTVLITGGTSGIGLGLAAELIKKGSKVIICGRRTERFEAIVNEYPGIITIQCDVSVADDRRNLLAWVAENHPETNIIINNAGIQLTADLTKEVDLDRVHAELDTNLVAPIHLSSLFVNHLSGKDNATIINISSGLAFVPIAFMPVYCASKAAVHSFTLSLRHQLRNTGIRVVEIAPPSVDTELGHDRRADKNETHGGIPVALFLEETIAALENDVLEAAIGMSSQLRAKRDDAFEMMNSRFN